MSMSATEFSEIYHQVFQMMVGKGKNALCAKLKVWKNLTQTPYSQVSSALVHGISCMPISITKLYEFS